MNIFGHGMNRKLHGRGKSKICLRNIKGVEDHVTEREPFLEFNSQKKKKICHLFVNLSP